LLAELEQIVSRGGDKHQVSPEDQARWLEIHDELKTLWASESFTREYEKRGASGMNATTDVELTRYFVSLPRNSFEFWGWAESERLVHPVMRQFYQERDVVMEERRMRYDNDPGGKLYETLLGQAFRIHPYRNPVIGYPDDINSLTATMMSEFHKAYYVPKNIVIAVVGDVDPQRDLPVLERYFGRLPRGTVPGRPMQVEPPQEGERHFSVSMDSAPEMMIAYHKPPYPDPVDPPLSILFEVLAGSPISPLYEELVRKQRIATSVSSYEAPGNAYPNLVIFSLYPRAPHTNKELLAAFDKVLSDFLARGITPEQLENAKRSIAMAYLGQLRSNESLAMQLASAELIYNDWRVMVKWYDEVMKVTEQDVMRVAREYLRPNNRTIGYLESTVLGKKGDSK